MEVVEVVQLEASMLTELYDLLSNIAIVQMQDIHLK